MSAAYREWLAQGQPVREVQPYVQFRPSVRAAHIDRLEGALDVVRRLAKESEHLAAVLEEEGASSHWIESAFADLQRAEEALLATLPSSKRRAG